MNGASVIYFYYRITGSLYARNSSNYLAPGINNNYSKVMLLLSPDHTQIQSQNSPHCIWGLF